MPARRALGRTAGRAAALIGVFVLAAPAAVAQPPTQDTDAEAARLFDQALQLVRDQNWAGALAAFQRAYDLSGNYVVLFNLGVCRRMLREYPEAVEAFDRYVRDGGDQISPEERADVDAYLNELRPLLATVVINVDLEGAAVEVDGAVRGMSPLATPLLLGAGDHTIAARLSGRQPVEARVRLAGGENRVVELRLAPAEQPRPEQRRGSGEVEPAAPESGISSSWFWTSVGVAGALAIGGAITGGMTVVEEGNFDDAVSRCSRGDTDACREGREISDRYDGYQLATNILLPAAGAVAVSALTLFFFTDFGTGEAPPATIGVGLAPGGVAFTAALTF